MTNVVFVMADELRCDVAYHERYADVAMPYLDGLRKQGVTFTQCYSQYPICCPSRAATMCGKYPHQIGLWNNNVPFPREEKTMGHWFGEQGYESIAFGKTHGMNPGFRSITYDIKKSMGFDHHGYKPPTDRATGVYEGDPEEFCDFKAVHQFGEYLDARDGNRPFLAYIGIYSPHPPLYPPRHYAGLIDPAAIDIPDFDDSEAARNPAIQKENRSKWSRFPDSVKRQIISTYLGMCTLVDDCLGRILGLLKKNGLEDDTIIVFTSDHGDQLGDHGMIGKFHNLYDESLRVPLVVRVPGKAGSGRTQPQMTEMVDIYPTLCDLAGVSLPGGSHAPAGRSAAHLWDDPESQHRDAVHIMTEVCHGIRTEEWKLAMHGHGEGELYDLRSDPGEHRNRFNDPSCRDTREELTARIMTHLIENRRVGFNEGPRGFFG